jgi:hypothetical protein
MEPPPPHFSGWPHVWQILFLKLFILLMNLYKYLEIYIFRPYYSLWFHLFQYFGRGVTTYACVAGKIGSSLNIVNSRTSASLYQTES